VGARREVWAVDYTRNLRIEPTVDVMAQSRELFDTALAFYLRRPDKGYSMTDCMSMVICHDAQIADVLTANHDFEQEGFTILL
jgi:predicted nucleic acid-binding protein